MGEFFDSVPDAEVVHAGSNRGFAGGVNLGLARAEGHVLLLNSDTLVPDGWLERLEHALVEADDIGMVGPMSNCVSGGQHIEGLSFDSMDEINAFALELAQRNQGELREVARLVGFCLLIRDSVVQELGAFDESYGIGNFEDDDYCLRAVRAGYRLCVAEDAFVFHYGHRTFFGMGVTHERWKGLIEENERRFFEKWDVLPEERLDAARHSKRLNEEAKRAIRQGDLTQAVRRLKQAIDAFPLLEANYNDLGVALWEMGEKGRAVEFFERAVRLNPEYTEARDNLREAADALGREVEAQASPEEGKPNGHHHP